MLKEIRVFAPASVSNVACGFDVIGFAIDQPGDEVVLRLKDEPGVVIGKITGDEGRLPLDPALNTAGAPVMMMLKDFQMNLGVEIEIFKNMPLGSGLGSSAASAVAAAFAANELLDLGLSKKGLLHYALQGEQIASGAIHADNVAPSLYGGFILIRGYDPIDIVEIPVPDNLYCTVIHPAIEINTKESRRLLPTEVPLTSAKIHWGNTAGLVAGLFKNDFELISRSLKDVIIEPVRSKFIPAYDNMKKAALEAGSLGCNISGSGPSVFALADSLEKAKRIGDAMQNEINKLNIESHLFISKVNNLGPKIISKESR